jgi:hypothetical protein
MRAIVFLIGLASLALGVLSYFDVVSLPVDIRSKTVTIGAAEFRLDYVLMMLGVPLMLLGLPTKKARWK